MKNSASLLLASCIICDRFICEILHLIRTISSTYLIVDKNALNYYRPDSSRLYELATDGYKWRSVIGWPSDRTK